MVITPCQLRSSEKNWRRWSKSPLLRFPYSPFLCQGCCIFIERDMPDLQEIASPEAIPARAETRPPAPKKTVGIRWKQLTDKAAGVVITAGGVGIIASIALILFVIVAETLPLWRSPTAQPAPTTRLE